MLITHHTHFVEGARISLRIDFRFDKPREVQPCTLPVEECYGAVDFARAENHMMLRECPSFLDREDQLKLECELRRGDLCSLELPAGFRLEEPETRPGDMLHHRDSEGVAVYWFLAGADGRAWIRARVIRSWDSVAGQSLYR